jgi:hypothetical protein
LGLDQQVRAELKRRGAATVRVQLSMVTATQNGTSQPLHLFPLLPGRPNVRYSDAEVWLREQEIAADQLAEARHRHLLRWARVAGVGAVTAAVAAIASLIVTILAAAD